jgi:hypothetical protein
LRDAVERWAEIELSKRSDGGKEPMRAIRKDVLSALGDRDLVSIKRGDILEILDTIITVDPSVKTEISLI